MSSFSEIVVCIRSKLFDKATTLLKTYQTDVDGRITFKLLRSLVTQLKINSGSKDEDSVREFVQICCAILDCSQDFTAEDAEFTQGVLSLYHLVTLYISTFDKSDICVMLSKTILGCLRKVSKTLKDVESIAANFFAQVWNVANKVSDELCLSYRSLALTVLVHGGSSYWNRVIDKLVVVVQEPSSGSFQLTGCVFDEFVLYFNNHVVKGSQCITPLLQVWAHLVLLSSPTHHHEDRTQKLKLLAKEIQESKQIYGIIDLVLNLFGPNDGDQVDMFSANWANFVTKDYQIILVRIIVLALGYSNGVSNQSVETKWERKKQIVSVINLLLYFYQEGDRLGSVIEANLHMDPTNLRNKCLSRACSISYHLLKLDPSKIVDCQTVIHYVDQFINQETVDEKKKINQFSCAEIFAHNVGAFCMSQKSDYTNAAIYFRKALEYHMINQPPEISNGEIPNHFSVRWTALYDSRKAARDWSGIVEDFALCFSSFYDINETNGKAVCRNPAVVQHLFVAWSRFKREVHHEVTTPTDRLLEMTVLDVFKLKHLVLENNSAWSLLFEEFQAFDRRKGWIPKVAFSSIAQQSSVLARSPFQKGVSNFFLSREGDDYAERYRTAKKAVDKLVAQASSSDCPFQGQIYLALAYMELYVSQQEMLKKKTEEEMVSLGPLIQSSSNNEVPPGEDDTSVTRDGTSVDAVSYSYLKLELELKNQEWMVKCLQQWEELVQFGWCPEHYSSVIFNCLKSLGYYFSLNGNSFFSARAWFLTLRLAESAKCDDEIVLATSELLRLGLKIDSKILLRCQELIENKTVVLQDQILFLLNKAWAQYFQHNFVESWRILEEHVLKSPAIKTESPSKSILLLISQAYLLRSLLVVVPEELSHIPPSSEIGSVQAGVKATQSAYMALKCYVSYAQEQHGWDFYGQEWNALRHFLLSAISLSRIYLYTAAPREARFFLKEALSAAQRHVSVLRTAEALLELCHIDLMLDNTMDCQSKLVLICHLMGVAPPIVPESETAVSIGKKSFETPISPVQIRSDRRKGTAARKVPEVPIQGHQDATQLMPQFNYQGASPNTKAREICDGIFPEHVSGCVCLTCSGELVMSIRCAALLVQSKLWSFMGFHDLATEDFQRGQQLVQSISCRLKSSAKTVATKSSAKRLFDVPDCLSTNEIWAQYKMQWFQPPIVTCMELLLENAMHRLVTNCAHVEIEELLAPVKTVMYEFYLGPLEHRVIKLTSAIAVASLQQPAQFFTPEQKCKSTAQDEENEDVIILEGDQVPKTPAFSLRKPLDVPAPRRVRWNLMGTKIDATITIDDDDDSDGGFSRRRLGQPQKAILYSSDSDSDVLAPSPPPAKAKSEKFTEITKNAVQEMPPPESTAVQKKFFKRGVTKVESNSRPVVTTAKSSRKAVSTNKAETNLDLQRPLVSDKAEQKLAKSKSTSSSSTKKDSEIIELSSRLAVTKISPENTETKDTRPRRTTRSTRK
ncbi:uncharacterized protein LOC130701372 [Daphnia carinata]|uniref:uncharacterized protein LOC130701372 n=1 Tax=Daphnia carinata TaxID=120202 RepID=UPI00257A2025|nr:uncharacterized protein LOC130701372 [Daphnia carinata]